jgi:bifunctional enzyme CysN/CysC
MVCWMDETRPLTVGGKYAIKHTTRPARTVVRGLQYRLDVNTLHRDETRRELRSTRSAGSAAHHGAAARRRVPPQPTTGGFILIDEGTNRTVGAGMILEAQ